MQCGVCMAPALAGARFCQACGAPLTGGAAGSQAGNAELRHITALFCDLVGSTELSTRLGPEEFGELIQRYHQVALEVLGRYGADVHRYVGDGLLIHFGWPVAHDDDAERALRAGLEIASAVDQLDAEFPLDTRLAARVGIHTGPALVGSLGAAPDMALGESLNVAARLQEIAEPGTVVLSAQTHALVSGLFIVEDLGRHELKGLAEPFQIYRVHRPSGARTRLEVPENRLTPLIGRDPELELLAGLWERTRAGHGQMVVITGEPGIGKSRLAMEFHERVRTDPHYWMEGGCSSYTRHSAFAPIIQGIRKALSLDGQQPAAPGVDAVEEAVAALGLENPETIRLITKFFAPSVRDLGELDESPAVHRRRFLELATEATIMLADARPMVLLIEDLQWADPSTLELLDRLFEHTAGSSLMLVVTARPEFDAARPTRSNFSRIDLKPLTHEQTRSLVAALRPGRKLADATLERVVSTTDGIPLFAEELGKTLIESPRPAVAGIPATLETSLMARLDHHSAAKRVAQRAAVIGREFDQSILAEVADLDPDELRQGLERLLGDDLLVRRGSPPDSRFMFRHVLIQDAAYGSLLKRKRRELHASTARALERRLRLDPAGVPLEPVGRHYENADEFEQAATLYRDAAEMARQQSAHPEARAHLERAIALIARLPDEPRWQALEAELQTALASAVIAISGYGDRAVEAAYERARDLYERLEERRQVGYALAGLSLFYFNSGEVKRGAELASGALELGDQVDDDALRILASVQVAVPTFYQGRFAMALAHADAASALYDSQRHRWLGYHYGADQGVAAYCFAALALMRLGRADTALWRVREAVDLARSLGDPFDLAYALFFESAIHWNRGDHSAQEATASRLLALAEEHQFQLFAGLGRLFRGAARALATGEKAALNDVYEGSQTAGATGFRGGLPAFVCLVAESQRAAGLLTEAQSTAAAALATASDTGQPYWDAEIHRLAGEIQIELGAEAAGEAELKEGLDCSVSQNALWPQLRVAFALANLWADRGRRTEAHDLLSPICVQFNEGRTTPVVAQAAALLRSISDSGTGGRATPQAAGT